MAKARKDKQGRVLHQGETWKEDRQLYCYAYTDALGKRKFVYSKDLKSLREKEENILKNKLDGLDVYVMGKADLNYVFDRYLATKDDLRSTTYTHYVYNYNRYVRNGFGKKKIAEIRYSEVLLFYYSLLDKGLSISTVENVHTLLHPTFQLAVRDMIIRNNPSDGVLAELKKNRFSDKQVKHALTLDEQRSFLNYLNDNKNLKWKPVFIVMFGTGCRIGEVIGLRWDDIDLEKRSISINHNITYGPRADKGFKCEYRVSLPKTEAGIRTVPMLDEVYDAFMEEKEHQALTGIKCGVELDGMKNFIFCNRFGNLINPSSLNKTIKRIVSDFNAQELVSAKREKRKPVIIPRFSNHTSRHTFCSRLCENETNIKVIQSVLGHKDIQTTLDIYAEVSERKKQEAFRDLNKKDVF